MKRQIDPKFAVEIKNGHIELVNPAGIPIPADEPLILFRARDRNALFALRRYRFACVQDGCNAYQLAGIDNRIRAFEEFAKAQPERMKQPGITEGK